MLTYERDLWTGYLMRHWRRIEQVIAPLLIIQRVANQNALTGETAVSAQISEFRARSGGQSTAGSGIILDGDPMRSAYVNGKNYGELEVQYCHECDRYRPDTDKV